MEIRWKIEEIVFETLRESEVWADSLANEFHGRTIDGYITPDFKIAYTLLFFLASNHTFRVYAEECLMNDLCVYKVWVAFLSD
ncbi:hypothetical protein [Bacillus sp. 03113]|uniref:hypothetical protein n=1 Tax=Bacillus sp. 03113 TaxID=2578211 RepID=UPI0037BE33F3